MVFRSVTGDADRSRTPKRRQARRLAGAAAVVSLMLAAAGCGSSKTTSSAPGSKSSNSATSACGTLSVWVDSTRDVALKDYEKSHPCVHLKVQILGFTTGEFQTKIGLLNKEGSGWPDVAWDPVTTDAGWIDSARYHYAQPLNKGLIPSAYFKQWASNSLDVCTYGGKIYCLRNDIAANVLWYNAPLMKKFGYKVPTTWAEYEALGKEVAAQHPGYVIGTIGDTYAEDVYFWGSGCPSNELQGVNTVLIDTTAPPCERAAKMLDPLVADGSVSTLAVTSADYVKKYGTNDHTLMGIGPTWYGLFIYKPTFKSPAGTWAVARPLTWPNFKQTGDVGGGIWQISSHASAEEQKLGVNLIEWVTTNKAYQATAPTYPANIGAAKIWLKSVNASHYFATNPAAVFKYAAGDIWPGSSALLFSTDSVWADTAVPLLVKGKLPTSVLAPWGTALKNEAISFGYQVKS